MTDETKSAGADQSGISSRTPPYISFKTLLTFVEDQQDHGLPTEIDRSVLTRFSGSVSGQLLAALKFLRLIDDSQAVQSELQDLVDAYGTDNWRDTLTALVKRTYAPMVAEDLARLTPAKFHDVFKTNYQGKDAVVRKCEVFFLKAAEAAGIEVNPRIAKHRAPRQSSNKKPAAKKPDANTPADPGEQNNDDNGQIKTQTPFDVLFGLLDPAQMDDSEQEAVWTLLKYLKKVEE